MAGLVPAIHVFGRTRKFKTDARDKRGHDEPNIIDRLLFYSGLKFVATPLMQ